eukprot:363254-Chlamydomonas_euryale.AAC.5
MQERAPSGRWLSCSLAEELALLHPLGTLRCRCRSRVVHHTVLLAEGHRRRHEPGAGSLGAVRIRVRGTGSRPTKGMPVLSQNQSPRYGEQTHEGYACVERRKTEGIKQRAGRCHKGNATVAKKQLEHAIMLLQFKPVLAKVYPECATHEAMGSTMPAEGVCLSVRECGAHGGMEA